MVFAAAPHGPSTTKSSGRQSPSGARICSARGAQPNRPCMRLSETQYLYAQNLDPVRAELVEGFVTAFHQETLLNAERTMII